MALFEMDDYCKHKCKNATEIKFNHLKEMDIQYLYDDSTNSFYPLDELDEFVIYHKELNIDFPAELWLTEKESLHFDAKSLVEESAWELSEEAAELIMEESIIELQKLLDNWCASQSQTDTYYPDYSRYVRVSEVLKYLNHK